MAEPKNTAPKNMAASVRARLQTVSKDRKQPFQLLLTRYVLERLLYRLSLTAHREQFALKGAMLFTTWFADPFRPTRDLDLLGFGSNDAEGMLSVFRDVLAQDVNDGVLFDADALAVTQIREELEYGGLRLTTGAMIDGARIRVVIDIGFGDAIEPGLAEIDMPVLLDLPAPRLRAYRPETVIAEKFQAMVLLGRANSRMKDFYDIWILLRHGTLVAEDVARAIRATFERRRTLIPDTAPDALTDAFAADPMKQAQWMAFARDVAEDPGSLGDVIAAIGPVLMGYAVRARGDDAS